MILNLSNFELGQRALEAEIRIRAEAIPYLCETHAAMTDRMTARVTALVAHPAERPDHSVIPACAAARAAAVGGCRGPHAVACDCRQIAEARAEGARLIF